MLMLFSKKNNKKPLGKRLLVRFAVPQQLEYRFFVVFVSAIDCAVDEHGAVPDVAAQSSPRYIQYFHDVFRLQAFRVGVLLFDGGVDFVFRPEVKRGVVENVRGDASVDPEQAVDSVMLHWIHRLQDALDEIALVFQIRPALVDARRPHPEAGQPIIHFGLPAQREIHRRQEIHEFVKQFGASVVGRIVKAIVEIDCVIAFRGRPVIRYPADRYASVFLVCNYFIVFLLGDDFLDPDVIRVVRAVVGLVVLNFPLHGRRVEITDFF